MNNNVGQIKINMQNIFDSLRGAQSFSHCDSTDHPFPLCLSFDPIDAYIPGILFQLEFQPPFLNSPAILCKIQSGVLAYWYCHHGHHVKILTMFVKYLLFFVDFWLSVANKSVDCEPDGIKYPFMEQNNSQKPTNMEVCWKFQITCTTITTESLFNGPNKFSLNITSDFLMGSLGTDLSNWIPAISNSKQMHLVTKSNLISQFG